MGLADMMIRIILGVAIIAAVIEAGIFLSDYFNQSFTADALNSQIESETRNLAQLLERDRELKLEIVENTTRVDTLSAAIADENKKIPNSEINPNDIIRALLTLGQNNNISIIPLTIQDWTSVTINGHDYRKLKMSLNIVGTKENIVRTITRLPELYNTLVIENIALSTVTQSPVPQTTTTQDIISSNISQIKADLSLAFYAK